MNTQLLKFLSAALLFGLALPGAPAARGALFAAQVDQLQVVTVSGYGPTRQAAEAAAFQAARETSPRFRVKKQTFERSGSGWVCTMEIFV